MPRLVFHTMGTVVSVVSVQPIDPPLAARIEETFADADARFSLYSPVSEISRIARGELALASSSEEMREMYDLANDWRNATGGSFTPNRPDGVVDLSGVVKAWAMRRAASLLDAGSACDWCLNVGGDVVTNGRDVGGRPWTVGIVDPESRSELLTALVVSDARPAVATSGSAERGDHIWTVSADRSDFVQVSVAAPDIIMADVLATAIVSAGPAGIDDLTATWPIDVLAVHRDGSLVATPGMRAAIDAYPA